MLTRGSVLKRLAKMNTSVDDLKPERGMRELRILIVDQGIRGYLETSSVAAPALGRAHEQAADAAATTFFTHKPALDESNRTRRIAAVGVRAQSHFQKAGQLPIWTLRDKYRRGQRSAHSCREQGISLTELFLD